MIEMSRLLQCDGNGQWWYAGKMIEPYQVEEIHELLFTRIANLEAVLTKISKMNDGQWSREDMAAVARDALLPLS